MTLNILIDLSDELSDCKVGHKKAFDLMDAVEAISVGVSCMNLIW